MKSFLLNILILSSILYSQDVKDESNNGSKEKEKTKAVNPKTITEFIKGKREIPGLITLYQDTLSGKLSMVISNDQIGKEFIYFVHGINGHPNTGVHAGNYRGSKIITLNRYFNRVELEVQNHSFYFDPESPLSRSADANIATAILASELILAKSDSAVAINVDNMLLSESLHQITRGISPNNTNKNQFKLGKLIKDRSKYVQLKNYPENTSISVQYVYSNPTPTNWGTDAGLTDARSVNVTLQHSFIVVPDNDYKPRFADPRVGFFATQVTNMTEPEDVTPYRDLIHRWNLKQKHPEQFVSEPVEPIVWWIENTTPHEFRDAIKDGVLAWNVAFEKAGFNNALEVKIQPDTASWDAGDIRYNVIRWTSSPNPMFGGYGPSFVNPKTGQILGADIMLEYVHFTNRVKYERLWSPLVEGADSRTGNHCVQGVNKQHGNIFAEMTLKSLGRFSSFEQRRLLYEAMVSLVMHEIGHTLGLNHNFHGSYFQSLNSVHDRNITESKGLMSSVMDYDAVNIGKENNWVGQYYSTTAGPYDIWAVQYGYTPLLKNPLDEIARNKQLLDHSTKIEYRFGNDADDMRSPGKGLDPRIMIYDMSSNPLGYAQERIDLIRSLYETLRSRYENEFESYHAFTDAFYILNREHRNSSTVISRYIGGLYMDRSMVGQDDRDTPFVPIDKDTQKWAMTLLNKYVFSPNAFDIPENIYNHLQWERRGFSGTKDHKIHDQILDIQKTIFDQLLHVNVLKRISDSGLYGNKYNLSNMLRDLTNSCFAVDAASNVSSIRQNLQIEYTERLIKIVLNKNKIKYDHLAVSAAHSSLNNIIKYSSRKYNVDASTKAHREYLLYRISEALDT